MQSKVCKGSKSTGHLEPRAHSQMVQLLQCETCCEDDAIRSAIQKILLTIFILLNLIVLHTTITHGVSWYYRLYEILNDRSQQASCIYLVARITMLIFNSLYFIATVLMYMDNDIPPIHLAKCNGTLEEHCIPPHYSTIYKDKLTAFPHFLSFWFFCTASQP